MSRDYAAEGMDFEIIDPAPSLGWNDITRVVSGLESTTHLEAAMYCAVLYGLAAQLKPKVVVEIGCQFGLSARTWLAVPGVEMVHSYDVDPKCAELLLGPKWRFHLGRSQDIAPMECDLLYVDGDHSYEAVCSDMARHGPKVRVGGLVILDDYHRGWPGKMQWIDERWDGLQPIIIGPTAVVRVTPESRIWFGPILPKIAELKALR